jgi:alpha-glucosidase
MSNEEGRTVTVPLSFLKTGSYKASILQDGADINSLATSEQTVDAGQSLTLVLAPSGGAAVTLTPVAKAKKRK